MCCKFGAKEKEEENNNQIITDVDGNNSKDKDRLQNFPDQFKKEEDEKIKEMIEDSENYPKAMIKILKNIRENPSEYANFIEDSMDYIIEENKNNEKIIFFKKHLKIRLFKGEEVFRKVAKELKNMKAIQKLEENRALCVPLPNSISMLEDKNYLKREVEKLRERNIRVDAYFKAVINIPELSALMLMVDDIEDQHSGLRRKIILRRELTKVGISSGTVEGKFVAYFVFSK